MAKKTGLLKAWACLKYGLVLLSGMMCIVVSPFMAADIWQSHQAKNWPQVQAEVTYVDEYAFTSGGAVFHMRYQYTVDGQRYKRFIEDKITRKSQSHLAQAKQRWQTFVVGKTTPVFYKPTNPEVSLIPYEVGSSVWAAFFGFIFLFGGGALCLMMAYFGWKETKHESNEKCNA
jgi:hypothetical protein